MGQALEIKTHYTLAEYLVHEEHSPVRSDYYCGELFAMAGTSDVHNLLAQNLTFALRTRGGPCRTYMENLKLEVIPDQFYVYPDVLFTCDPRDQADHYVKRYPRILAEVLSPGTESYDRKQKLPRYLQLPTLDALLLIWQSAVQVELYMRKGSEWVFSIHTDRADSFQIGDIQLSVAMLYEGVEPVGDGETPPVAQ
ncbi:MAG: Uma2 family endonuclease [Bacteroidia bacterium]